MIIVDQLTHYQNFDITAQRKGVDVLFIQYVIGGFVRLLTNLIFSIKNRSNFPDLPKGKPVIIACNHHSELDPLILATLVPFKKRYLPLRFIVKHEYFSKKRPRFIWKFVAILVRILFKSVGCLPVKRGGGKPLGKRLSAPIRLLGKREPHTIAIYVEGGKSKDEIIQTVKPGCSYMGLTTGAVVLPIVVLGTFGGGSRSAYEIDVGEFIELPHIEDPPHDTVEYWNEEIRQGIAAIQKRHH